MSHGGLAPRRPDQHQAATPRGVSPGSRATQVTNSKTAALTVQIVNKPGAPVITQDGGVANMASASVLEAVSQPPTAFQTFAGASRIWAAHLSFAVGTNNTYSGVTQLYALVRTQSGIVLAVVDLAVAAANTAANGDADLAIPGIAVANEDKLMLDVNNGTSLGTGGVMHASTTVMYSTP